MRERKGKKERKSFLTKTKILQKQKKKKKKESKKERKNISFRDR